MIRVSEGCDALPNSLHLRVSLPPDQQTKSPTHAGPTGHPETRALADLPAMRVPTQGVMSLRATAGRGGASLVHLDPCQLGLGRNGHALRQRARLRARALSRC
jgi:hypothetical protein